MTYEMLVKMSFAGESHSWLCDCRCDASGRVDKAQTDLRRRGVDLMMCLKEQEA